MILESVRLEKLDLIQKIIYQLNNFLSMSKETLQFEHTKDKYDQMHRRKVPLTRSKQSTIGVSSLMICSLFASLGVAQQLLSSKEVLSSYSRSKTEGQMPHSNSFYVSFTGDDGLLLPITMPRQTSLFDYTLMFWFRSAKSLAELQQDESILNKKAFLFEMPGSAACYVTRTEQEGPSLQCLPVQLMTDSDAQPFKIDLAQLNDIQSWMHLTYSANYSPVEAEQISYIKIDDIKVMGPYWKMQDDIVYYGAGLDFKDGNGPQPGLPGDYRQFYYTLGYVEEEQIDFLKHQEKTLELETRGYYMFSDSSNYLSDAFRPQKATELGDKPRVIRENEIAAPICQSLPQELHQLPRFTSDSKDAFTKIPISNFKNEQQNFGYTVSIWLRNSGEQGFSSDPKEGREQHALFSIKGALSIWFDTPTSVKVYVFAKNDYAQQFTSDSLVIPFNEWINIQVTVSATQGITAMTFNQNGDQVQLVHQGERLAQQYPKAEMSLLKSFAGVPYTIQAWQKFIELPVTQDKSNKDDMIANYNFIKSNYKGNGWEAVGGDEMGGTLFPSGGNFEWVYDKVPSKVDYESKALYGQLKATKTMWNGVTCPDPVDNQMYFTGGKGTGFKMEIEDEQEFKEQYTVEFWFRPNPEKASKLKAQGNTYLFTMENQQQSAMTIYVDQFDRLICSPFGIGENKVKVVYEGVDLLNTDSWQHVSCILSHKKFVKVQYLAVNLNLDDEQPEDISQTLLLPKSFSKSTTVDNPILRLSKRWMIYVGNDKELSKTMFGSYKDIRLWNSVRSDEQLYQHRFRQVRPSQESDLIASFKFMDGDKNIKNQAQKSGSKSVIPKNIKMIPSDRQNLICASDTYFDPKTQDCVRNPYLLQNQEKDSNIESQIILYRNELQTDQTYNMVIESLSESALLLPGADLQPQKSMRWGADRQEILDQAQQNEDQTINSIALSRTNSKLIYQFQYWMSDQQSNDFFAYKKQSVAPVKCHYLVDTTTDLSFGEVSVEIKNDPNDDQLEDLCMEFQAKKFAKTCGSEDPLQRVIIRSQPDVQRYIRIQDTAKSASSSYQVCIPKDSLKSAKNLWNRPFNMVYTVPFNTDVGFAQLEIVYKVTIYSKIEATVIFDRNVIVTKQVETESSEEIDPKTLVLIDAQDSRYTDFGNQNKDGLVFHWECEGNFQQHCDKFTGSPILQVTINDQKQYGIEDKFYTFKVIVSSMAGGHMAQTFSREEQFIWTKSDRPEFRIGLPGDPLLVTANQQISIQPLSFRFSDSGYTYNFYFSPENAIADPSKVQISSAGNVLTIQPGALKWDTVYRVNIKVYKQGVVAPGEEFYIFGKTATWPLQADNFSVELNKMQGKIFVTDFEIKVNLDGQMPEGVNMESLKYMLYSQKLGDQDVTFRLMPEYENLFSESGELPIKVLKLPQVQNVILRIQDENTEYVEIRSVTMNTERQSDFTTWFNTISELENTFSSLEEKWSFYQLLTLQATTDAQASKTTNLDAKEINNYVAEKAKSFVDALNDQTLSQSDKIVIREIVKSFKQSTEDERYLSKTAFEIIIEVMDILTKPSIYNNLQDDQNLFINDYVKLLGNLLRIQPNYSQLTNRRLLQDSSTASTLSKLQTAFIKLECKTNAELNGQVLTRAEGDLEIQMFKVDKEYLNQQNPSLEVQFVSQNGEAQIDLPIDELLQRELTDVANNYLCVVATFFQGNRIAERSDQKFNQDAISIQMQAFDVNGNNVFDTANNGFKAQGMDSFHMVFKIDFDDTFYRGTETFCMYNQLGSTAEWSNEGCSTIRTQGDEDITSTIKCICDTLYDYDYAIISIEEGLTPEEKRKAELRAKEARDSVVYILLFIVVPLGILGCMLPCLLVHYDHKDFMDLHDQVHKIDYDIIQKLEQSRRKASKHEIFFNEIEIKKYVDYQSFNCWKAFLTFNRTLHPFVNLFAYYDYKFSRLARFTLVLGQVSLITILNWMCFAKTGNGMFNNDFKERIVFVSLLLSLITLPLPRRVLKCIERQIYVLKDEQYALADLSKEKMVNAPKANQPNSPRQVVTQPQDIHLDFDKGGETTTEMDDDPQATLMEPCVNCKIFFLLLIYVFWAFAIALSISFMNFTGDTEEEEGFKTYLELTAEEAWYVVISWYLSIFGWGWLVFNEIRIILTSLLAPSQAKIIVDRQADKEKRPLTRTLQSHEEPLSCVTCALIPPQSVEISLDALYIIDIKKNPDKYKIHKDKFQNVPPLPENLKEIKPPASRGAKTTREQQNGSQQFVVGGDDATNNKAVTKSDDKRNKIVTNRNQLLDDENVIDEQGESLDLRKQTILLQGESVPLPNRNQQ